MTKYLNVLLGITLIIGLFSCGKESCELTISKIKLEESIDIPIKELPRYINIGNDSLLLFNNGNESILIFNIKNGKLIEAVSPDYDFSKYLDQYNRDKYKGAVEPYNLNDNSNAYIKNYPRFRIECVDYEGSTAYIYAYLLNPITYSGNLVLEYIPLVMKRSNEGMSYHKIERDYIPDIDLGLTPQSGFIYGQNCFFVVATYLSSTEQAKIVVCKHNLIDSIYQITDTINFPFPNKSLSNEEAGVSQPTMYLPCDFSRYHGDIYFTNGLGIYRLNNKSEYFSINDLYKKDGIVRRINSFDFFASKELDKLMVLVEEETTGNTHLVDTPKSLVLLNHKTKKIIKKKYIGRNISAVKVNGNNVYVVQEEEDGIYLVVIKLKRDV